MGVTRAVKWSFDAIDEVFDGFTNDTYWNGFLNVWVTAETHAKVLEACKADLEESGLDTIKPDPDGLYDYSCGFTTQEVADEDDETIEDALNAAVLVIHGKLGVKTGDVAGLFFTGDNGNAFRALFKRYIAAEREDLSG